MYRKQKQAGDSAERGMKGETPAEEELQNKTSVTTNNRFMVWSASKV